MSLVPNVSYANTNTPVFLLANVSSLNVNSISTNLINANIISTVTTNSVSSFANYISAADVELSSIYATVVDLDGQVLTANPTELLLNGVPLATTSNLSSIQDWALDPAISSINANGNDVLNANYLYGSNVSTINVRAQTVFCNNMFANNIFAFSTYTSTISSLAEVADFAYFGHLSSGNAYIGNLSSSTFSADLAILSSISANQLEVSSINSYYINTENFYTSTIQTETVDATSANVSSFFVSSINGSEFTSTGITVQVAGVSSLVANSISSIGAEIRQALISTIVFSPSLNPSLGGVNVNLGLGGILGNVIGWGAGVFGAAAGTVGLVTGMTALATGRQTQYINEGNFELVNTQTQLQISTLGTAFSTIYRFVSSINPEQVPGEEIFISTIHPGGGLAIRSFSDPLATLSSPQSTIQSFGQWVSLADTLDVADWALYPAVSTIQGDVGQISSMTISSINGLPASAYENTSSFTNLFTDTLSSATANISSITNNTISTATILGANNNLFGIGIQGLEIRTANSGQVWISSPQTNIAGLTNASTVGAFLHSGREVNVSTATVSSITFFQQGTYGLSSLMFLSTQQTASGTSTATILNTDFSIGTNDLFCGQVRIFAGTGQNAAEIAMTGPDGTFEAIDLQAGDRIIRNRYGTNAAVSTGYFLDTYGNSPFFSTLNAQSTALMCYFPSTTQSTIGISTLTLTPAPIPLQMFGVSSFQAAAFAISLPRQYRDTSYGIQLTPMNNTVQPPHASTISISSFQVHAGGGLSTGIPFFWQTIGMNY